MYKYKLTYDELSDQYSILRTSDNAQFLKDSGGDNIDYQQFLQDVKEQGIGIVEGPDITTKSYAELRKEEYPPLEEQLDKIYHSTLTAWKAEIKAIKDKYPKTITGGSTVGDVPAWVQTEVDKLNS